MASVSQWVRAAGAAARAAMKPKRKNPDQSKKALAAKFNARVNEFIKQGLDPDILPEMIRNPEAFTHRELRQLVSAATKKKSSGVYQQGQALMPEFRKSYASAMVDIINARRAKRSKLIEKLPYYSEGKLADVGTIGRIGSLKKQGLKPLKKERIFKNRAEESYYIHNLQRMLDAEHPLLYRDNLIVALRKNFGDKADKLISYILRVNPDDVIKAHYSEDLFDITTLYEQSTNDDEYLGILEDTLKRISKAKPTSSSLTEEQQTYVDELFKRQLNAEREELAKRMMTRG